MAVVGADDAGDGVATVAFNADAGHTRSCTGQTKNKDCRLTDSATRTTTSNYDLNYLSNLNFVSLFKKKVTKRRRRS
jgi:hypothetical protein